MTTEFMLVRHGASELSTRGVCNGERTAPCDLTPSGVLQARALQDKLRDLSFDLAICSRFARAQQTLGIGLGDRDVPRKVEAGLDELRFGAFEDKPIHGYREWSHAHATTDRPCGGESRADVTARYAQVLRDLLSRKCDRVLVVGHGIPLTYLMHACAGERIDLILDPIPCATPHPLSADALLDGLGRIESWAGSAIAP